MSLEKIKRYKLIESQKNTNFYIKHHHVLSRHFDGWLPFLGINYFVTLYVDIVYTFLTMYEL